MGLAVDGANRHDMKLVRATVDSLPVPRPAPSPDQPQGMCLDKGYDFDEVRRTLDEFGFTAHIRSRGEEAKAITCGITTTQPRRTTVVKQRMDLLELLRKRGMDGDVDLLREAAKPGAGWWNAAQLAEG